MAEKEYIEREALIRYTEKQEVIIKDGTSIEDAMRIQGNVFRRCIETCPTADVVPKSEVANAISDLKKIVHDKAVHPNSAGVDSYIKLKVFDAVLQEYVSRLEGK